MKDPIDIPDKPIFRPDEAAPFLGVVPRTVRRWIKEWEEEGLSSKYTRTQGGHGRIYRHTIIEILLKNTPTT